MRKTKVPHIPIWIWLTPFAVLAVIIYAMLVFLAVVFALVRLAPMST